MDCMRLFDHSKKKISPEEISRAGDLARSRVSNYGWDEERAQSDFRDFVVKADHWNPLIEWRDSLGSTPALKSVIEINQRAIEAGISPFGIWGYREMEYWGGSCQYTTIGDVVFSRFNLRHLDFRDWQTAFGVSVKWDSIPDHPGLKKEVRDYFQWAMDDSWDLWSALPATPYEQEDSDRAVCPLKVTPLEGLEVDSKVKSAIFGPIFNQIAQSDNHELGLMIVALIEAGLLDYEDTFEWGFDT